MMKNKVNDYKMLIIVCIVFALTSLWAIDMSTTAMQNNMALSNLMGFHDASILYHIALIINTSMIILLGFCSIKN